MCPRWRERPARRGGNRLGCKLLQICHEGGIWERLILSQHEKVTIDLIIK